MAAQRFAPPGDLTGLVECLWCARWDLRGQPPHETELLSDPSVHFSFEAGTGRVVGVWTRLWTRTLRDEGFVRAVKLRPGAARALLRADAQGFSDRITPLDELLPEAPRLAAAVLDPKEDEAGLLALARWVRERAQDDDEVRLAVETAAFIQSSGLSRVDAVAKQAGMSVRTLQRLFRRHLGASPKWVIRRVRLQEAALRVEAGEAESLADLALSLGYADQAHLARDFAHATGQTLRGFERRVHR